MCVYSEVDSTVLRRHPYDAQTSLRDVCILIYTHLHDDNNVTYEYSCQPTNLSNFYIPILHRHLYIAQTSLTHMFKCVYIYYTHNENNETYEYSCKPTNIISFSRFFLVFSCLPLVWSCLLSMHTIMTYIIKQSRAFTQTLENYHKHKSVHILHTFIFSTYSFILSTFMVICICMLTYSNIHYCPWSCELYMMFWDLFFMCFRVDACIHMYMFANFLELQSIEKYLYTYIYACINMYTYIYVWVYAIIFVYKYIHINIWIYVYEYIYMNIYIYINI